jgi:hypothetical protein
MKIYRLIPIWLYLTLVRRSLSDKYEKATDRGRGWWRRSKKPVIVFIRPGGRKLDINIIILETMEFYLAYHHCTVQNDTFVLQISPWLYIKYILYICTSTLRLIQKHVLLVTSRLSALQTDLLSAMPSIINTFNSHPSFSESSCSQKAILYRVRRLMFELF